MNKSENRKEVLIKDALLRLVNNFVYYQIVNNKAFTKDFMLKNNFVIKLKYMQSIVTCKNYVNLK